jgi:hypothetical protein
MFWWFTTTDAAAIRGLRSQLAAEQAAHEATRRTLAVCEAERDKLALVASRDRERIRSEIAAYARQRKRATMATLSKHADAERNILLPRLRRMATDSATTPAMIGCGAEP